MPVVRIGALPQPPEIDVAAVLEEEPRGTWATWDELEPGRYSEGGDAPGRQPRDTHLPLVSLVAFEGRSDELVERMLTCVADTLARELGLRRETSS
jgi:hypothetical protein